MCMYTNVYNFICQILSRKSRKTRKKAHERYENLSKEEKKNGCNTVVNVTKIFDRMKKKACWVQTKIL